MLPTPKTGCNYTATKAYFVVIIPLFGPVSDTLNKSASAPVRVALPSCEEGPSASPSVAVNVSTVVPIGWFSGTVALYTV